MCDAIISATSGKFANKVVQLKYKRIKAHPTEKAVMHKRAGQKRYSKSTVRNARKRLQKEKDKTYDIWETISSSFLSGMKSFWKRFNK